MLKVLNPEPYMKYQNLKQLFVEFANISGLNMRPYSIEIFIQLLIHFMFHSITVQFFRVGKAVLICK